jgi:hypothetical protein
VTFAVAECELEQIHLLLENASVQTTARHLGRRTWLHRMMGLS